jgi:hypothetical protein
VVTRGRAACVRGGECRPVEDQVHRLLGEVVIERKPTEHGTQPHGTGQQIDDQHGIGVGT